MIIAIVGIILKVNITLIHCNRNSFTMPMPTFTGVIIFVLSVPILVTGIIFLVTTAVVFVVGIATTSSAPKYRHRDQYHPAQAAQQLR